MKIFFVTILVIFILPVNLVSGQTIQNQETKPNIVFILADDLGYGELGVYGQKKIETPHIDQLAKNGMTFSQHYAFPVCAPSRYLLLTGKHSGHAFIRDNHEWSERGDVWNFKAMEANPFLEGQFPIPDSTVTLAKLLKEAGYTTGIIGKWGLGAPMTVGEPNNQGFDYFYGFNCQRQDHTYYPGHLWENGYRVPLSNKVVDPNVKLPRDADSLDGGNYALYQQYDYAPDYLIQSALTFIERNRNDPFFLFFTTPLPHVSLQAPEKWVNYYRRKFGDETPFTGGSYFPCRYPRATYAAMISTLDEQVGQIVQKLKDLHILNNTIIIFSSDNGPTYNGGSDSPWFNSAGPFKSEYGWGKGFVHEGGIRVPLIVQWPNKIRRGSKSDLISANWDMLPTLCTVAGISTPGDTDGISMAPTLLGNAGQQKEHPHLYWEFPSYGGQQAVRMGKWKAIRKDLKKGNLHIRLFDLEKDIQELHDISHVYPEVVKVMENIMRAEHRTPEIASFRIEALEQEND
ncbi:MAG: arylsulfatase [Chitinophagaceae bacterium]|nr:arylsulfatase [Chitinophagaceae bacterium]